MRPRSEESLHRRIATLLEPQHDAAVALELSAILARNLAAERVRRRWSQAELAGRLGVGRTTIGSWENGQRLIGVDLLVPLCLVFEVPLSVLLMGADEQQLRALGLAS